MGYISWLGKYDTEDSVMVALLRKAGAVFYVKTSVPQTLMVCETVNNIIGRTVNPRNKNWSCGGSSGGEGAIVGFRGGIIGVGTDIGKLKPVMTDERRVTLTYSVLESNRWLHPCSFCIQFPVWYPTKSRKDAICKDGQQYGGTGNSPQCDGTDCAFRSR
jgi:hypothetical protein